MGNLCEFKCNVQDTQCWKDCTYGCKLCFGCSCCDCCNVDCGNCCSCDWLVTANPCLIPEQDKSDLSNVLAEYDFKCQYNDPYYQEIFILQHKLRRELVVLKVVETEDERDFKENTLSFMGRLRLKDENIIHLRYLANKQVDQFCSQIYKNYLFFDFILTDLSQEVKQRRELDNYFQEEELWALLKALIQGLSYLHSQNIFHNCLKLERVYIDQYREFKICDPTLFGYNTLYDQIYHEREEFHQGIYLSPQQLISLEKHQEIPFHDKAKTDVFMAAMLVVEAGTLTDLSLCYDYYSGKILRDQLESKLSIIREKYHDSLYHLLKEMLIEKEPERPYFKQIIQKVNMQESKISKIGKSVRLADTRSTKSTALNLLHQSTSQSGNNIIQSIMMDQSKLPGLVSTKNYQNEVVPVQQNMTPIMEVPQYYEFDDQIKQILGTQGNQNAAYQSVVNNNVNNILGLTTNFASNQGNVLGNNFNLNSNNYGLNLGNNNFGQSSISGLGYLGLNNAYKPSNSAKSISGLNKKSNLLNFKDEDSDDDDHYSKQHKRLGNVIDNEDKSKYIGDLLNGVKNGRGKYIYKDGSYYQGDWKDDKMEGNGILYFSDGRIAYDGEWKDDRFHGKGILYSEQFQQQNGMMNWQNLSNYAQYWVKYDGEFQYGQKNGFGNLTFSNGEKYVGNFRDDKLFGQGSFYNKQQQLVAQGIWKDNIYQGK